MFKLMKRTFHIVVGMKHVSNTYNKQGKIFLSTLEQRDNKPSDRFTGVVESPVVTLSGDKITLLVGGGKHSDTYIALCTLDGKEVKYARGNNIQDMQKIEWNVKDLVGKKVFLRMLDGNTGVRRSARTPSRSTLSSAGNSPRSG